MRNRQQYSWKSFLSACALMSAFSAVWGAGEQANSLQVHVLDRQSGEAVEGAAVCLGTAAKQDQFGARRTDTGGVARFADLPPNPLVLTVSGRGLLGSQQLLEPVSRNRIIVLKVVSGGGGPRCDAPLASAGTAPAGLSIERVTVREASREDARDQLLVSVKVSGAANQVRLSERADFAGANWQPLTSPLTYQTQDPGKGNRQLYVQVRQHVQAEGASIEVVSPVKRVRYSP